MWAASALAEGERMVDEAVFLIEHCRLECAVEELRLLREQIRRAFRLIRGEAEERRRR